MDENTPAEIYARIRNDALEEAALISENAEHYDDQYSVAHSIRALKTEAK